MNSAQFRLATCALAAGTVLAPSAFGFAEVARGNLVATASFSAAYDTNVFANSSEVDDFVASFNPGLSYLRDVGSITTSIKAGVNAFTFADTDGQDSIDPYIKSSFNLDRAEKGSASLSLDYARSTEANASSWRKRSPSALARL